jgi:hypothetical protein
LGKAFIILGGPEPKKWPEELEAQAPECPVHGKKMKLVRGPKVYFFGCVKGTKCGKKAWLSSKQRKTARVLDTIRPYSENARPVYHCDHER